jgi:hypothetical protein
MIQAPRSMLGLLCNGQSARDELSEPLCKTNFEIRLSLRLCTVLCTFDAGVNFYFVMYFVLTSTYYAHDAHLIKISIDKMTDGVARGLGSRNRYACCVQGGHDGNGNTRHATSDKKGSVEPCLHSTFEATTALALLSLTMIITKSRLPLLVEAAVTLRLFR